MAKSKFQKSLELSHKGIKAKRAAMHNANAKDASIDYVRALKRHERHLERELMDLEDINVGNTTSLYVVNGEFKPEKWISKMNELKVELKLHKIRVETSEEIHSDWFGESVEGED